jgi:hypothetical protein
VEKLKITFNNKLNFTNTLTIVFIILKLTNYINWSWFWVLSPIIFSFLFLIFFIIISLFVSFINQNKYKF